MASSLPLNRRLQNARFDSWKIGKDFVQSRSSIDLPGVVFEGASDAVDFLHTRAAVLRNHLIESQGRLFIATRTEAETVRINEVISSASGGSLQLKTLAGERSRNSTTTRSCAFAGISTAATEAC